MEISRSAGEQDAAPDTPRPGPLGTRMRADNQPRRNSRCRGARHSRREYPCLRPAFRRLQLSGRVSRAGGPFGPLAMGGATGAHRRQVARGLHTVFGAGIYLFLERAWTRGRGRAGRFAAWSGLRCSALRISPSFGGATSCFPMPSPVLVALLFLDLSPGRQVLLGILAYAVGAAMSFSSTVPMERRRRAFSDTSADAAMQARLMKAKALDLPIAGRKARCWRGETIPLSSCIPPPTSAEPTVPGTLFRFRDAAADAGRNGSLSSRLVFRGLRCPPTAALGIGSGGAGYRDHRSRSRCGRWARA